MTYIYQPYPTILQGYFSWLVSFGEFVPGVAARRRCAAAVGCGCEAAAENVD